MKFSKKTLILLLFILFLIIFIILIKKDYNFSNLGNNKISKTTEEVVKYILNISSYDAKIEVTINSNNNINKYILSQQYTKENTYKQTVIEPNNIKGLTITYNEKKLELKNVKLNLSKIYQEYNYITENNLFLNYFIEDYKNSEMSKAYEENGQIVMEAKIKNNNKYTMYKKLYIDKNKNIPIKMEIKDINQKTSVYILYNEIKINSILK